MDDDASPAPDSPGRNSLYIASANVEDLTRSLRGFSRARTPEPVGVDADSEYVRAWHAVKAQLEGQLVASAEIGQALLQRHEAFVRKVQRDRAEPSADEDNDAGEDEPSSRAELEARVRELVSENAVLERRANNALLSADVAEAAARAAQAETGEAHAALAKLTAEHARASAAAARARAAAQERDDMRQERDALAARLRAAEARASALGGKNAELREQVRQLAESVEEQYQHRQELSEEILHDARARLAKLQASAPLSAALTDNQEVTRILESLVEDNEALVKSNAELQALLADAREDLHALREEAAEHRADGFSAYGEDDTIHSRRSLASSRMAYGTAPGPISPISSSFSARGRRGHAAKRSSSIEIPRRAFAPATPPAGVRSLSPESLGGDADAVFRPLGAAFSPDATLVGGSGLSRTSPQKPRPARAQHRGVQTDEAPVPLSAFRPFSDASSGLSPTPTPGDNNSDASSLLEGPSTLGALLERLAQLFARMAQADAATLTTRLKRQHLAGADVSYISRSTVEGIVAEVAALRGALRGALADDAFSSRCSRTELRALLRLARDLFRELGTLRATLNDIVLDPSLAPKVRDMVFNAAPPAPSPAPANASSNTSWIAPLTKLFGAAPAPAASPAPAARAALKAPVVPTASTTTVNIEFTGSGAGRAVSDSLSRHAPAPAPRMPAPAPRQASASLMGIFAGAPRAPAEADPWVVVKGAGAGAGGSGAQGKARPKTPGSAGLARSRSMRTPGAPAPTLSRGVDAVLDAPPHADNAPDIRPWEQARTLRRGGLSDSSIRSTFVAHADAPPPSAVATVSAGRQSAFGPRVGALREPEGAGGKAAPGHARKTSGTLPRAFSPGLSRLLPDLAWGADADEGGERTRAREGGMYVGSFAQGRDPWRAREV